MLHQIVDPAAVIPSKTTEGDAKDEADRDADETDGERDAHAVKDAESTSHPSRSEPKKKSGVSLSGGQMRCTSPGMRPYEFIGIAVAEEADRARIDHVPGIDCAVDSSMSSL